MAGKINNLLKNIKEEHKLTLAIVFLISLVATGLAIKLFPQRPNNEIFAAIMNYLAIIFGFSTISVVAMTGSSFSKKMYITEDAEKNTREIYVVEAYFKLSWMITVISVIMNVIYLFINGNNYVVDDVLVMMIVPLFFTSLFITYLLSHLLIQYFISESSRD